MKYLRLYETFWTRTLEDFLNNKYGKGKYHPKSTLNCRGEGLTSLYGIEKFGKELVWLTCEENLLKSLEGIETCINLQILQCDSNKLETLEGLENCTKLEELNCSWNKLKDLLELEYLPNLIKLRCISNNWEYPLPVELVEKFKINYSKENIEKFESYEFQKEFLDIYPEKANDLKPFGYHERIKKEFPSLVVGSEWGFFDLERSEK